MRVRKRNTERLIQRAKEYLGRTFPMRVALSQTARAIGASPSSLSRAFRAGEKTSFYRYALNMRLARAAALLATSNDLSALASDLGFASHSHFTNAFRRWAGRTPSDYRALVALPATHTREVIFASGGTR